MENVNCSAMCLLYIKVLYLQFIIRSSCGLILVLHFVPSSWLPLPLLQFQNSPLHVSPPMLSPLLDVLLQDLFPSTTNSRFFCPDKTVNECENRCDKFTGQKTCLILCGWSVNESDSRTTGPYQFEDTSQHRTPLLRERLAPFHS